MRKLIILLSVLMFITNGCNNVTSQQPSDTENAITKGKMPFENLVSDDVQKVKMLAVPPEVEVSFTKDQITQLIAILNEVVIYEQVSSETLAGQMIQYQIVKSDGSVLIIKDFNPYLVIDDVWYKAKNEPCEDFNQLANKVINKK